MIDRATYNNLAIHLEHELTKDSRIDWRVDRYDARLGDACISEETAQEIGTTPEAHFELAYKQMVVGLQVQIAGEVLRIRLPVARALIEDKLLNRIDIIKQLAADVIASKLMENRTI